MSLRCLEECINAAVAGYQKIPSDNKACHDDNDMAATTTWLVLPSLLVCVIVYVKVYSYFVTMCEQDGSNIWHPVRVVAVGERT